MRLAGMATSLITLLLAFPRASTAQQTYHGDGATNGGNGGWVTDSASSDQCLKCHVSGGGASDKTSYLKTGHKNMLRKVTAGKSWTFADGSPLTTSDTPASGSLYNSGSTFDWNAGKITVGSGPLLPYSPDPFAGAVQDLFYIFGGWIDPAQLDTIWRGGFTGEQFASGNYECARCHTTGYRFDDTGVEPTFNGSKISAADFSRVPTDYDPATGPAASWMLDGIQCERCHNPNLGAGHTVSGDPTLVTNPTAEAATSLCLQCHREENVDTVSHQFTFGSCSDGVSPDQATCVAIAGNNWVNDLVVYDGGSCSDGVSPDYGTCVGVAGNTWSYAPFFDHESGPTFLNSPHARFSGSLSLLKQNDPDMSLALTGAYNSAFKDPVTGLNGGCTACHDPHQSLVPAVKATQPFLKQCLDCHGSYANLLSKTDHVNGTGTPFDTGGDLNASCATCHMSQGYHLVRISTDPSYSTFPTAAQVFAGGGQSIPNSASDGKLGNAVWSDVDLACGQCHVGSGLLPGQPGVAFFDKPTLASRARCIHHQPVIHPSAGANGSISPAWTSFVTAGASQAFAFTPNPGYEVASYTVDGGVYSGPIAGYTFSGVNDCHTINVQFAPMPTITATAGTGGSITPAGVIRVNTGGSQTFTMAAKAGYQIQTVIVDGATSLGPVSSYTFTNIGGASHTIAAYFIPVPAPPPVTFKITVGAYGAGGGTITNNVDGNAITASGSGTEVVAKGGNITFTFKPNTGFKVGYATVNGSGLPSPLPTTYTFSNVQFNNSISVSFYRQ